jgi:hypothetical protein
VATVVEGGRLVAIDAAGAVRDLAAGLEAPAGVAVLDDGAVVVAESGAGRVVGLGGRFGPEPVPIGEVPGVSGLVAESDGRILATSTSEGRLVRMDPAAPGLVVDVVTGLSAPTGIGLRAGVALVADQTGSVTQVDLATGAATPLVAGFGALAGVVAGPSGELLVSDAANGRLIEVIGDQRRLVAELSAPGAPATDPPAPQLDLPWTVLVPTSGGIARLDPVSGEVLSAVELPGAAGVGVARASAVPGTLPPPTTAGVEPAPGSTGAATEVQEEASPGDESSSDTDGEGTDAPVLLLVVVALAIAAVAGGVTLMVRRSDELEAAEAVDGELLPSFEEAFGPCLPDEMELEAAQAALDVVRGQIAEAEARVESSADRVADAIDDVAAARSERQSKASRRRAEIARGDRLDDGPHPIHQAEGHLTTDDGRSALADYRAGRISPAELARRWEAADESAAIGQVRSAGERTLAADLDAPGQDERRAMRILEEAEHDLGQARDDLERRTARQTDVVERVAEAQRALDACHARLAAPPSEDVSGEDPAEDV